jgi:hypothetical protein
MSDNSLKDIKIVDIESGVPFTVYFGCNGTQYVIHEDSIGFESEPMEVTITINYRQKTRIFTDIDTIDEYLMVDTIKIKMGMHNRHIDVELGNTLWGKKDTFQKMYLWGCTCDSLLMSIYPLRYIIEKCYCILDKMDFTNIMLFGELTKDTMIFRKSMIHGIVTSRNQELAERCLDCRCGNDIAFLWDDVKQEFFDTDCQAICILIEELVENNRPELLRTIPLRLRILLTTHFNAEGKHEIVAALNHYHKGDYKDPRKDLML